jgi:hypothetical protein
MFSASYRVFDRFSVTFGNARHTQSACTGVDIHLEVNWCENGVVKLFKGSGEDLENSRAGFGVLTRKDAKEGIPLGFGCLLVNDDRSLTSAFVDGAGPTEDAGKSKTVQFGVAVIALIDLHADNSLAKPVRWEGIELARAAVGAIAVGKLAGLYHPFRIRHGISS